MFVLHPYKLHRSTWLFDDERYGLVQEPFVCGTSEMIEVLAQGIPNAEKGFRLTFSAAPFPGYAKEFRWLRSESGGNWYQDDASSMEGWLCPVLFHYFEKAPARIYARADA
jgi:hypothetical protein